MYCNFNDDYPFLREPSNGWPGLSTSDKILDWQEQYANSRASDQLNGHLLCLSHQRNSLFKGCTTCLKETSGSDSIGEFLFVSGEVEYVVLVRCSLKTREQVSQPCITMGHCYNLDYQFYTDELCEEIRVFWFDKVARETHCQYTASKHGENSNVLQPYMYLQCMKVEQRNGLSEAREGMRDCMTCLGRSYSGLLVHSLGIGSTPGLDAPLLFRFHQNFTEELRSREKCLNACPRLALVEKQECYKDYHLGVDSSPAENQMSVEMLVVRRKNDDTVDGTACILAMSIFKVNACCECLDSLFEKEGHKARKLNQRDALISIPATMKAGLAKCFHKNGQACTQFLFLSSEVCNDAMFYPTSSAVISGDRKGSSTGFDNRRNAIRSSGKSSSQSDYKLSLLIDEFSSLSLLPDPSRVVAVVAARYEGEGCLACLLLVHEVLVLSTEENYIWMVERKEGTPECKCTWKATGKRIQHFKMGLLRPIPYDLAEPAVHYDTSITNIEAHRITLKIGIDRLPLVLK
ncbi:hypothetical protein ABG067_006011 [Albugo candida]